MSGINQRQTDSVQARIKSLRESVDRADALASVQARTIAVLESSLAMYDERLAELATQVKIMREAL